MPSVKIYREGYRKLSEHEVESKIEELEEYLKSKHLQVAFMVGTTPQPSKDIEESEMSPEEYIPHQLEEIFQEISDYECSLYFYRCLLDDMKYCPDDIEWDD